MQLKQNNEIGVLLSNACTLEIIDNEYKILKSSDNAFSKVAYWKNNEYIINDLKVCDNFKKIIEIVE